MGGTDYAKVRQLAEDLRADSLRMLSHTLQLQTALRQLQDTFLDNDIQKVLAYTTQMLQFHEDARESFAILATELRTYADLLAQICEDDAEQTVIDNPDFEKQRSQAIRQAWALEAERVRRGCGTRNWTVAQQAELLRFGKVSGFEGQHMKSAAQYPQYAGDPYNIQFLTPQEHLYGGHGGKWDNPSNGRLDLATGTVIPFGDDEPSQPELELTNKYDPSQYPLTVHLGRSFGYNRHEDNAAAYRRLFTRKHK